MLETLAAVDGEPCRRKDNKEQLQTDIVFSLRIGQEAKPVQFQLVSIGRSIRSLEANSVKTELARRYGARDVADNTVRKKGAPEAVGNSAHTTR